jgi:hypothetical protein
MLVACLGLFIIKSYIAMQKQAFFAYGSAPVPFAIH